MGAGCASSGSLIAWRMLGRESFCCGTSWSAVVITPLSMWCAPSHFEDGRKRGCNGDATEHLGSRQVNIEVLVHANSMANLNSSSEDDAYKVAKLRLMLFHILVLAIIILLRFLL